MIPDFNINGFFMPDMSTADAIKYQDKQATKKQVLDAMRQQEQQRQDSLVINVDKQPDSTAEQFDLYSQSDFDSLPNVPDWIEHNCYDPLTVHPVKLNYQQGRLIKLQPHQRRILQHIFSPTRDRLSKYTTIIWSEPKKSGKTAIAAFVVAYFAENVDPPNNVLVIANKKDQAEGRIYKSAKPTLKGLGANVPVSVNSKPVITMQNGTTIKALPNSPATEAGDSYCLTAWSEIWAFKSEDDERLFAELMPIETVRVSMQWIETYAGYRDESKTLLRMFLKGYKTTEELALADGAQYVPELADIQTDGHPACIEVPDEELFIYWSHERRMPWQTEKKKQIESKKLPKTEAIRLMENRWQNSSADLLQENWILASVRERAFDKYKGEKVTIAVDASMRHDNTSIVGTFAKGEIYYSPLIEIFEPLGKDIDLTAIVENRVKQLFDEDCLASYYDEAEERWITPVYFDPYQLHTIRLNLIEYGIDVIEFNQSSMRTLADTMWYELYRDSRIINPDRPDFNEHLRGAKGKYLENEQVRIIKGTTKDASKIDAAVAQSMSCYGTFLFNKSLLTEADTTSMLLHGSTENNWF